MKAPKPQDNPKKKADVKPTSMSTNSGVSKANAEDKDRVIRYYENPDYLIKNKVGRTGYWNEFQKYLQDYTLPNGEKFIQNEQVNKGTSNEFSDKAMADYRAFLIKKYGEGNPNVDKLAITPEDVKQVQTYYAQNDPNFKVDARIGGETSQLRYPTLKKVDVKVGEGMYAPVMYGNKQYLAPAEKYNTGNFTNDLIPYDPSFDTKIDPNALKAMGTYTTQSTSAPVQTQQAKSKGGIIQKLEVGGRVKGDKNGDGFVDAKEQQDLDNQTAQNNKLKSGIGSALGGVGSGYYAAKQPTSEGDSIRSAGLSAASQSGPIGGVIGGVAAMGDKIGAPIKSRSERLDSSGNLVDPNKSKQNAIGGSLLSPSKALVYRAQSGNWTDVTGDAYNKDIENKAKKQINEVKAANRSAKMKQLIDARNNQEENPTLSNPYDLSNATFDENHNLILANNQQFDPNRQFAKGGLIGKMKMDSEMRKHHEQMCADGGEIKGEGGPKDDKINAKVKEGSFVVPAENAELAKGIRKLYLKAPIKKANLKQEEGEEVKLSNGEHLFTPEENEYLESIGIDLEDLAPNAEHGEEEMAKGGLTANKAKMILHDKKVHGKPLTDQQRKFFGAIASGQSIKMACGGMVKGYAEGGPVKGTRIDGATWNGKNWVSDNGSVYSSEGGKKFTDKYNQQVAKQKSNEEQRKASEINVYSRKLKEAKDAGNSAEANRLQAKLNQLTGTKESPITKEEVKQVKATKPSLKAPTKKQVTEQSKTVPFIVNANPDEEVIVPGDKLSPNERAIANADAEKATVQSAALNKSLPQSVDTNGTPQNRKRGILDVVSNIDPTMFVGIGQAALGKNMLAGEKRPIDKAVIDPTYNAAVNRSIQDAKFGLSPEEKFMAKQDIENAKRDAVAAGINYAGGSGVQAFNLNRAAINDAWKAKLGLKVADQESRMAKQKYADAMAADRANILSANRRQAYNDAMNTFLQKQQAGSELVGAGLQNIIGAYRFNKELQNERNVNDASNPYGKL